MQKYIATFRGHTLTRNSARTYSHAWLVTTPEGNIFDKGFSASRELAAKAAASALPRHISARDKKFPAIARHHKKIAKDDGFDSLKEWYDFKEKETNARRAAFTIEIVAVET